MKSQRYMHAGPSGSQHLLGSGLVLNIVLDSSSRLITLYYSYRYRHRSTTVSPTSKHYSWKIRVVIPTPPNTDAVALYQCEEGYTLVGDER